MVQRAKKKVIRRAKKRAVKPAQETAVRFAWGGVSSRPGAAAIHGVAVGALPEAAVSAGAFPGFVYNGGPVISSPQVYTSFWGALWSDADHQQQAARLNQFHADLLQSNFMNVLSQYGVGNGAGAAGAFVGATFMPEVPNALVDADVHNLIQSAITAGNLPEPTNPSNVALVIYLDENTGVDDPNNGLVLCEPTMDTAFGYHSFFVTAAGNPFYYAVIPALDDNCISESCPTDPGCSLHLAQSPEQRRTQVSSHEFAEMTSDPQLNAWVDPQNGENGDICSGQSDVITGQRQYLDGANDLQQVRRYELRRDFVLPSAGAESGAKPAAGTMTGSGLPGIHPA